MEFCVGCGPEDIRQAPARARLRAAGARQIALPTRLLMAGNREDARTLGRMLRDDGLLPAAAHPPFGSFNQPFSPLRQSAQGREADIRWLIEFTLRCGLAGVKAYALHTGGAMLPDARPWETDCALAYVRALIPAAKDAGVVIAVENTNHATPVGFYAGMEEDAPLDQNRWKFDETRRILEFVGQLNSPAVKICYDTGHSHLLGRMLKDGEAFLGQSVLYHLHDNDGAGNDAHIQPGYGNAPWQAFFDMLARAPGDPTLFVEAAPRHGDLARMLLELKALSEGRVRVKRGGFLEKDEQGKIAIVPDKEAAV